MEALESKMQLPTLAVRMAVVIAVAAALPSAPSARASRQQPTVISAVIGDAGSPDVLDMKYRWISVTDGDAEVVVFALSRSRVGAGQRYTAVPPDPDIANLDRVRWVAARSKTVAGGLERREDSVSAERAAIQGAIWTLASPSFQLNKASIPDAAVRRRAARLVLAATKSSPLEADYPTSLGLTLKQSEEHVATVDVIATLSKANGRGIPDELVNMDSEGVPPVAQLTGDNGEAKFTLNRPLSQRSYMVHFRESLPPGVLLRPDNPDDGPYLVTAEGLPVRRDSEPLYLPGVGFSQIGSIGVSNLIGALSSGSTSGFVILIAVGAIAIALGILWKYYPPKRRIILGALVIVAIAAGLGLSQYSYRPLAPPSLSPERAAVADHPLSLVQGWATSSYQRSGQRCYGASAAFDGKVATAWVSAAGLGTGQMLAFELAQPAWVRDVSIHNGYQAGDFQYYRNGRARSIDLLVDGGYVEALSTGDERDKTLRLRRPYITRHIVLRIGEQTPGFHNVAISEVLFKGLVASVREDGKALQALRQLPVAPGLTSTSRIRPTRCPSR